MRRFVLLAGALLVVLASVGLAGASLSAGSVRARWVMTDLGTLGGQRVGWASSSLGSASSAPSWLVFSSARVPYPDTTDLLPDLFLLRASGSGLRQLTRFQDASDPSWSPDGRQIAYSSGTPLVNAGAYVKDEWSEIRVINASGRGSRRITQTEEYDLFDSSPSWSPDGRSIAFTRQDSSAPQKAGIYVIGADGTSLRRVTARLAIAVDWSPDGKSLAFVAASQGTIGTIDLETKAVKTFPLAGANDVSWAPSGRTLAVAGDHGITIVTPAGKQVRLIEAAGPALGVSWSPDGRQLAYGATRNGRGSYIYVVDVDRHGAKRITSKGFSSAPDWQP